MVSSIEHHASSSSSSHPVNLFEKVIWFNSAMTCRSAFGTTLIDGDQENFIGMMREVLTFAGGFELVDMFPSRKWIPYVVGTRSTLLKLHRELDKCYESIIEKHERNVLKDGCKGNNEVGEEDIVDVLLRIKEDEEGRQYRLTRDNIKAIVNDLFSAGTETTATAATWAMAEMMRHPNVLVKAQEEVREKLEGKATFEDDDMEELAYLKVVVKETLRLHPPIPLLLPRESTEEREIGGFVIPAKTRVIVNAWAIGRDPNTWKYPDCFWPERFAYHDADVHGNHFELIPFGAGRRMCPGLAFGLANVMHSLAVLLYHFDWELPRGVTPQNFDMSETAGLKATRKNDLCLIAKLPYPKQ
ncbi:hypothetical protein DM860_016380 [Cuscuta australis]|uniref:Cytochrome P450 n=1 Tax=Cuscuta australis TaxID=267555 RepID=A0A328DF34_9ASTE|nr:hypothetical protein DM860_016380 [Cuscuta australis]